MVQYRPLHSQNGEIRLVTLLPGKTRDAIRCTLSTAYLDIAPKFTALSYVWGDPSKTKPIILDGEPFEVTENLEAGLRAIRRRWRRCVLWIDAICINQEDNEEKNGQVPLMGRLYSEAPAVLVWLGPSSLNIKLFLSWTRAQATKGYDLSSCYWLWMDAIAALSKTARRKRDLAISRAELGYWSFLSLPYWGRMWTFQEYLLPRIEPLCTCGNTPPFRLGSLFETLSKDRDEELYKLAREATLRLNKYEHERAILDEEWRNRPPATTLQLNLHQLPEQRNKYRGSFLLLRLLYSTFDRRASKECDNIFALYGMAPDIQNLYPPDYTKSITEVLLQTATYMLNVEEGSCLLWRYFGLRDDRLSDARSCPSWMPDLTSANKSPGIGQWRNQHVAIEGVARPLTQRHLRPGRIQVEHTTLHLWALSVGACVMVIPFGDTTSTAIELIARLVKIDWMQDNLRNIIRKPETLVPRIARACFSHERISKTWMTAFLEMFYARNSDPDAPLSDAHRPLIAELKRAAEGLIGKELIVTKDGCFGISVGGVKDGDIVVISPDVAVPLVLTPDSSASVEGIKYYRMVGTAIIDGIMKEGELFDEEFIDEIAKRDEEEFHIH